MATNNTLFNNTLFNNTLSNNTLPCNITDSLTTLILAVVDSGINVTSQIASCPDLCRLSWGEGNPDFSGVGANFAWIFQAVLTILLGPVLGLGIYLKKKYFKYEGDDLGVEELHKAFFQSLALVSLPVNIATLIYLRKTRFLFEVTFLYWLNTMQVLSLCSTVLTMGLFLTLEDKTLKKTPTECDRKTLAYIGGFCCIASIAISLAVGSYIAKSSLAFPFLPELVDACGTYGNIIPKIPKNVKIPPPSVDFWAWLLAPMDAVWGWVFKGPKESKITFVLLLKFLVGLIAHFFYALLIAVLYGVIVGGVVVVVRLTLKELDDHGEEYFVMVLLAVSLVVAHPLVYLLLPPGLSIGMLYCLVQMQIDRKSMRSILGESYIDDQWGFGQILSVFIWFQVTLYICIWLYSVLMYNLKSKTRSSNAKEKSDGKTALNKLRDLEGGKGISGDVELSPLTPRFTFPHQ